MPIELTLTFDDDQAARLVPVIRAWAREIENHPLVQQLLESRGLVSASELTPKQQFRLILLFLLQMRIQNHEADEASRAARRLVETEVTDSFPLDPGAE